MLFAFLLPCLVLAALPVPQRSLPVCQNCSTKGYDVVPLADGVYAFTDGGYWAMAIVNQPAAGSKATAQPGHKYKTYSHKRGEELQHREHLMAKSNSLTIVDAWQGPGYLAAIQDILDWTGTTTVKYLVYSHQHTDHIGNAGALKAKYPNVKIIAQKMTGEALQRISAASQALRPVPDKVFDDTLRLPEAGLQLTHSRPSHTFGDLIIYHADSKTLMFVDVVFPRWIPFWNMAIGVDIPGMYDVFADLLAYDFDTIIGGHLTRLGDRADVVECKEFLDDLLATTSAIGPTLDFVQTGVAVGAFDPTAANYGNLWEVFYVMLDGGTKQCESQLIDRWGTRIGGVDVWAYSQCWALIEALRVDF